MPTTDTTSTGSPPRDELERELAGLDHLELDERSRAPWALRLWTSLWPKLLAVGVVLAIWQFVVWREWKPRFVLPGPTDVGAVLWDDLFTADLWRAVGHTMRRAVVGFAVSIVIGGVIGIAVTRSRLLRVAVGSMITGLQTMPSIAWFPLAILLFRISEQAILFVVVLGAAPSIANGIIAGVDSVPPLLRRVGRTLGASGFRLDREVVVPAAMPTVVTGLKQGWAFSWRSLMAGELLVLVPGTTSVGARLQFAREFSDAEGLIATMIVILVIGILVDSLVFGRLERAVLSRRGLGVERTSDRAPAVRRRGLVGTAFAR
ncbi:MAG: ABC transporter permease [Acidimicrobiales bacterium]|nr:ABC transporter permease [Acidimicrobiales bacterium]